MAREGLRSHLSGSVPVSIVAHLVVLLVLVVIPLADIVLPIPAMMMPSYVLAEPLPPPPEYVPRPPSTTAPRPDSGPIAPVVAPDTIRPEAPVAPPSIAIGSEVDGAVPGVGVVGSVGPPAPPPPAPPDPPHVQGPIRVAQLPEPPRKTVDVRPVYPEVARIAHKEGTVISRPCSTRPAASRSSRSSARSRCWIRRRSTPCDSGVTRRACMAANPFPC